MAMSWWGTPYPSWPQPNYTYSQNTPQVSMISMSGSTTWLTDEWIHGPASLWRWMCRRGRENCHPHQIQWDLLFQGTPHSLNWEWCKVMWLNMIAEIWQWNPTTTHHMTNHMTIEWITWLLKYNTWPWHFWIACNTSTYAIILHVIPSHTCLAYNAVQLGLFWMLLTDIANVGPRIVRYKPRFIDRDGATRLALVWICRGDLDERGDRRWVWCSAIWTGRERRWCNRPPVSQGLPIRNG